MDAASVCMPIVSRATKLRMRLYRQIYFVQHVFVAGSGIDQVRSGDVVGIGLIGSGGRDECDRRPCLPGTRTDQDRDTIFMVADAQTNSVDGTGEIVRQRDREIIRPAKIMDIVIMKMDRSIHFRRMSPIMFGAVPVEASHRSGRKIERAAVQAVGAKILDIDSVDAA